MRRAQQRDCYSQEAADMAMVNAAQLKKIHATAREIGMDGDALHDAARGISGKDSLKELTRSQAARLIDRLNAWAGKSNAIPNRATPGQQRFIRALEREMGWAEEPGRLRAFLEAKAGVSDVRFLDVPGAGRIIEAMKAMLAGGRAERKQR